MAVARDKTAAPPKTSSIQRNSKIIAASAALAIIAEPVFGIIKSVLGFRQFLLRGLDKVRGEWSLVTMAWNIKRIFALAAR